MSPMEELRDLAKHAEWAFEELVVDQKMQEANRIMGSGVNGCWKYLKEQFGSGKSALKELRILVRTQNGRRKTIGMKEAQRG